MFEKSLPTYEFSRNDDDLRSWEKDQHKYTFNKHPCAAPPHRHPAAHCAVAGYATAVCLYTRPHARLTYFPITRCPANRSPCLASARHRSLQHWPPSTPRANRTVTRPARPRPALRRRRSSKTGACLKLGGQIPFPTRSFFHPRRGGSGGNFKKTFFAASNRSAFPAESPGSDLQHHGLRWQVAQVRQDLGGGTGHAGWEAGLPGPGALWARRRPGAPHNTHERTNAHAHAHAHASRCVWGRPFPFKPVLPRLLLLRSGTRTQSGWPMSRGRTIRTPLFDRRQQSRGCRERSDMATLPSSGRAGACLGPGGAALSSHVQQQHADATRIALQVFRRHPGPALVLGLTGEVSALRVQKRHRRCVLRLCAGGDRHITHHTTDHAVAQRHSGLKPSALLENL